MTKGRQYSKESNKRIREELKKRNLPIWKLADYFNVSESAIYAWLRHEMPEEKQEYIISVIESKVATEG